MRIAIFDYLVTATNPAGSCHRLLLDSLDGEHEFTVFAFRFDNPRPQNIKWVRVPAILKPLAALFVSFHLLALFRYLPYRRRFAIVQAVESNCAVADVVYAHFCHRWFLNNYWQSCRLSGARGLFRWLDHALHSLVEPWVLRRAKWIVVPSAGLAWELQQQYPFTSGKITQISNPVDLSSFAPHNFNRELWRAQRGWGPAHQVITFVALGHFERKGLPILLEALALRRNPNLRLCVVGGSSALVARYRRKADSLGIGSAVTFVGHQDDVRPFLWAADLFALPSLYEVFPLAALQAAAAGLPLLVTRLNGVEDCLTDGESCIVVEKSRDGILIGLDRFLQMSDLDRDLMRCAARRQVSQFGVDRFASDWRKFYSLVASGSTHG